MHRSGAKTPAKGRRTKASTARKASRTRSPTDNRQKQLVKRLKLERDEALELQAASSEVLKIISSSPSNLKSVFEAMLANALRICEAKFGHVLLYDGERFHAAHLHDVPPAYRIFWEQHGPISPSPKTGLGRLVRTKQVAHIPDLKADPAYAEREPLRVVTVEQAGARSFLAVPMLKENELIGTIVIFRQEVRPFAEKQIDLVKSFADQAVIAIQNVRLFDEVQAKTRDLEESLRQQTATADVLKVISRSTFDLDGVLTTLAESATKLSSATMSFILLRDGDVLRLRAHSGHSPDFVEFRRTNPTPASRRSATARAFLTGELVHIPDSLADPDYTLAESQREFRAILGVPMIRDRRVEGVFGLSRREPGPFSDREIELVRTFVDQALIAIENMRLFEQVRAKTRDLEESLQQQTATADVLKVISRSTFDLQTVLNTLVSSAARLCDADMAFIMRREDDVYRAGAAVGFSEEYIHFLETRPITPDRGTITGRAVIERRTVQIPDVAADPEYTLRESTRMAGQRTALGVPLLRENDPIGVIVIARKRVEEFSEKQIELVSTFADQAVIAIENVRLFDELRQRTNDLTASLEDLRTAQDRLIQTEKLASLGQLTAGIAHEIKNPLNFVNNFSALSVELTDELNDVLKQATLADKIRAEVGELTGLLKDNLSKVVQHGKRADSIVKNMLLHSREGSGERRSVDINALVGESLNLAYHGARAEKAGFNITLKEDLDPGAGAVDMYPQEITRALINLITNGFHAATRRKVEAGDEIFEPALSVATRNHGKTVEIRIRDNGTGISPEVREKMFNPFFTTKPTGEGTGLGLSMTHDIIVKRHGGRIDVETKLGEFTEFILTLPRNIGTAAGEKLE